MADVNQDLKSRCSEQQVFKAGNFAVSSQFDVNNRRRYASTDDQTDTGFPLIQDPI